MIWRLAWADLRGLAIGFGMGMEDQSRCRSYMSSSSSSVSLAGGCDSLFSFF